jgi:uncharacterized RDD family membrane protein YckC
MDDKVFRITKTLLASRSQRVLNLTIDLGVQYIIWVSILETATIILSLSNYYPYSERIKMMGWFMQIFSGGLVMFIYYAFMEMYFSRTIAKYFTKTLVVMRNGTKPNGFTIITRTACRLIPFEFFSFFSPNSRGWHDTLSCTYVVKKEKFNDRMRLFYPADEIGDNLIYRK